MTDFLVLVYRFQAPPEGRLVITLNIPPDELKYLIEDRYGREFYAKDEKALRDEDVRRNISEVYAAADVVPPPVRFTSLGARTRGQPARCLSCYGRIVLEVDRQRVGADLVIFNGDVKTLGYKIQSFNYDHSWVSSIRGDETEERILERLAEWEENNLPGHTERPRLVGSYFEARLLRSLRPTDIRRIYVPTSDPASAELAGTLERVRDSMLG